MSTPVATVDPPSVPKAGPIAVIARVADVAVGLLLVGAAVLKLSGSPVAPFAHYGRLSAAWAQLAVGQWELLLGGWLLVGGDRPAARLAAVGTFAGFAAVSGWYAWVGRAACGCFGDLPTDPRLVATFDVAVVGVLAAVQRPTWARLTAARPGLVGFAVGTVGMSAGWGAVGWAAGSTEAVLARLRGEALVLTPAVVDTGAIRTDVWAVGRLTVTNVGSVPLKVVGGTHNCSASLIQDLPLDVPPGERRPLRFRLRTPNGPGVFRHTAAVWTDAPGQQAIPVVLTGRVVRP